MNRRRQLQLQQPLGVQDQTRQLVIRILVRFVRIKIIVVRFVLGRAGQRGRRTRQQQQQRQQQRQ